MAANAALFDNSLGYTYSSQVANVEINQRFKLFSFDPYRALSWLWGVRYFHLSDDFTLSGSDLYATPAKASTGRRRTIWSECSWDCSGPGAGTVSN